MSPIVQNLTLARNPKARESGRTGVWFEREIPRVAL